MTSSATHTGITFDNPAGLFKLPGLISQTAHVPELGLVWLSGQVAWDAEGHLIGAGDHLAQMQAIAHNIDIALQAVGTTRAHIIKETVYIVDYKPELLDTILAPLRSGPTPMTPPASTLVGVQSLFAPGYLVEVDLIATVR